VHYTVTILEVNDILIYILKNATSNATDTTMTTTSVMKKVCK